MHQRPRSLPRLLLIGISMLGAPRSVVAQAPAAPVNHNTSRMWRAIVTLRVEEQSNSNVFLLSDAIKARLDTLTTPAPPAARFADMRSANDYITAVHAGLGIDGPGFLGRTLSVHSDAQYDFYALNAMRRNIDLGILIAQAFPYHGRLHLRGRLIPRDRKSVV